MLLVLLALARAASPEAVPFELPASEAAAAWSGTLALAGFEAGKPGPGAYASLVPGTGEWTLRVRDDRGALHEVAVRPPVTTRDREDLAWLAESLVHPMVPPLAGAGAVRAPPPTPRRPAASVRAAAPPALSPVEPPAPGEPAPHVEAAPVEPPPPAVVPVEPAAAEALAAPEAPPGAAESPTPEGEPSLPPPASTEVAAAHARDGAAAASRTPTVRLDVGGGAAVRPGAAPALAGEAAAWLVVGPCAAGIAAGVTERRRLRSIPSVDGSSAELGARVGLAGPARLAPTAWIGAGVARHVFELDGVEIDDVWVPVLAAAGGGRWSLGRGFEAGAELRGTWDTRPMRLTIDDEAARGWSPLTLAASVRLSWLAPRPE